MNKIGKKIKNNKGFAVSGIIYSMLIIFLLLIFSILAILGSRKLIIDKQKSDVLDKIYGNDLNKEEVVNDDIILAFEYSGSKETPTQLPQKDDGYYVQSVSCQNGSAKWSNDIWALTDIVSENNKTISCKLTLGDDPIFDETIQDNINNLLPSGSNLLIGYGYDKEEAKTYTVPVDGSYKVVASIYGMDSSDCAGGYTLRVSLNGTYLTNQYNNCGLRTTYETTLSLKKGDVIYIQYGGYACKRLFHFIFKQ